jgi:hypothetical protein
MITNLNRLPNTVGLFYAVGFLFSVLGKTCGFFKFVSTNIDKIYVKLGLAISG